MTHYFPERMKGKDGLVSGRMGNRTIKPAPEGDKSQESAQCNISSDWQETAQQLACEDTASETVKLSIVNVN